MTRLGYLLLALTSLIVVESSFAAPARWEGKVVSSIQVQGLKRIEPDAILSKIQTKKGSVVRRENVAEDVRAIYGMEYFDDVEIQAEADGSTARLIIKVRERSAIAELEFEGNDQISTSDLMEVVKVKEWSILDINKIRNDITLIQKHYEDKGFYLAKVSYAVEKIKDGEVKLTYKIKDYDKVRIKKITFLNNKVFSDEQLKKILMETQEGGLFSFLSGSGSFKETAFKQDMQRLTLWYLDHGYVKFRFENPVVNVSDDKKWLYVSIYVEEGEQYRMNEFDFSGDLLFSKDELHSALGMKKDDVFSISGRNQDIQALTEKYQDLGYAFVNVVPKMNINDENKTIDIDYSFEKGNLVYFGEITVIGNSKTHDKVVRRELRVHEGQLFNGTNLRISRERVERLGFFQPGEVIFNTITRKGRDDVVDLEIQIKERSTGTITLGAGYGSFQKFFLTTKIQEINLLGRGQNLSFDAQYAADQISKSFNLGFTDPYAFDTRWSLGFDFFYVNFPIPNKYDTRRLGFDIRLGYPLEDDLYAYLTYKNEGMKITRKRDETLDTSLDEGVLSSVVASVVRDKRNNRFETTGGNYQSFSSEFAGVGGDKKFLKLTANNRVYFRVVGDLVFRNNVEVGYIDAIGGPGIPPAEKFYLGGPNNMRGYPAFQLGPSTTTGNGLLVPLGGAIQMFGMFELEYPLIREAGLKTVMFFDAGNTFSKFPGPQDGVAIRTDYGFGFRWFSPIGPLRFEWGFPLARRATDDDFQFWFFIGTPF